MEYLSFDQLDEHKIFVYKKYFGEDFHYFIGMEVGNDHYHYCIGVNKFKKELSKIPDEFKKEIPDYAFLRENAYCRPRESPEYIRDKKYESIKKKYKHCNKIKLTFNEKHDYLIYENKEKSRAIIYEHDKYKIFDKDVCKAYVKFIMELDIVKIYTSHENCNKDNSIYETDNILIKLPNFEYICIGDTIFTFKIYDEICRFHSFTTQCDVNFPFIVGTKYVYFLFDKSYITKEVYDKYYPDDTDTFELEYLDLNVHKNPENIHHYKDLYFKTINIGMTIKRAN